MRNGIIFVVAIASGIAFCSTSLWAQDQAPPAASEEKVTAPESGPIRVESYYRVHWGEKDNFVELYKKYHLTILEALQAEGVIDAVKIDYPLLHMPGEAGWDVRVTIVWRDTLAAYWQSDLPQWKAAKKKLFPDLAVHAEEEKECMELLDGHWDVIVYSDE